MEHIKQGKEFTVKLGNHRGAGAALFKDLKQAKINVHASACYSIASEAYFSIVPDDAERTERALLKRGATPTVEDVLLIEMTNEPGALAETLQRISELGVDVRSAYVTASANKPALAVIKTTDDAKVIRECQSPDGDEDSDA